MEPESRERVVAAYERLGGNISAIARELGVSRSTVQYHCRKAGLDRAKPLVGGSLRGVEAAPLELPLPGQVKRYILTSVQNNTRLHDKVWANLLALRQYYGAELLVGTFSYNKNAYGKLSVKRGTATQDSELWYDERIEPFLADERRELGHGLVWCGEMNIIPTAEDPLSGLETYSGRKSAVFPHAKHSMRSIATMKGEGTKLNFTTGTITQRNYIQKKAGLKAEHHHSYGALIVEVDSDGHWFARQLDADDRGRIFDLDVISDGGKVTTGHRVEAITWGDLHVACLDETVARLALGEGGMLETLRPKYQFIHDLLEGVSVNHHALKDPHEQFQKFLRGYVTVAAELGQAAQALEAFDRPWCETVVVDSNHDNWLVKWLREHDYRRDPINALLFLEAQLEVYRSLADKKPFNMTEWSMRKFNAPRRVRFLDVDQSFTICGKRVECGMHGHLGPNGARGNPRNLAKVGRRSNIGHTHSAGIYDGLYVAGTSTNLDMGYNRGPSSWTHSHIITYPNGKRAIVTMFAGKWRA